MNCIKKIKDPLLFPGFYTHQTVYVNTSIFINNLIEIDEISNTMKLDLFWVLDWVDPRLSMPALFDAMGYDGPIDLRPLVETTLIQDVRSFSSFFFCKPP
jgi:hypothetical protein